MGANQKKRKKKLKNQIHQSLQYQMMKTQPHPNIQQKRNQKQIHKKLLKRKVRIRRTTVIQVRGSIPSCDNVEQLKNCTKSGHQLHHSNLDLFSVSYVKV